MRRSSIVLLCAALPVLLLLAACGGSNSSSTPPGTGNVNAIVSDDAIQDWATIGVKVLNITLTPQGGGTPVTIYTAPSSGAPFINLVQLDQLGEIIGNASIPAGTYSQATITVSGNSSDIILTAAPDPEPGFPLAGGASASPIQVVGASGSPLTVPVTVTLSPALNVTANSSNALDLEFDLSHPAFIVQHAAPAGTIWTVNFNPAVRHHPIADITKLVLRHLYGTVTSVATDGSSFLVNKCFPAVPAVASETCAASGYNLTILADNNNFNGNNGTIFWNLDATPPAKSTVTNFNLQGVNSILSQPGEFVRVQARYQQNGTLVAVRVWASTSFSKVFVSPEGHVLDVVRTGTPGFTIVTENGTASNPITVDSNTQFLFNGAQLNPGGTAFLTNNTFDFVRGFKVHVNPVDPTASPLVADTVNIEIARYGGSISGANGTGFTCTRNFDAPFTGDDYIINLDYISPSTANGEDNNGNAINGFKWWDFGQPTSTLDSGATAIGDFVTAVSGSVNYGAACTALGGPQPVVGMSYATWNDPVNTTNAWSAQWAVLLPAPAPLATVTSVPGAGGSSFGITLVGTGCTPVTVDLDTTAGQATLAHQVNRNGTGVITITPVGDISPTGGKLGTLDSALASGTFVKVYGVPESSPGNGHLKAYVLFYFTGVFPNQ